MDWVLINVQLFTNNLYYTALLNMYCTNITILKKQITCTYCYLGQLLLWIFRCLREHQELMPNTHYASLQGTF